MKSQSYQAPKTEQVNFYGACPNIMDPDPANPSQANKAPRRASEITKLP